MPTSPPIYVARLVCVDCGAPLIVAGDQPRLRDRGADDEVRCPDCSGDTFWVQRREAYCECYAAGGQ